MGHKEEMTNKSDNVYTITNPHSRTTCVESDRKVQDVAEEETNGNLENVKDKTEVDTRTCLTKIRQSPNTATLLMFIILFLDGLLLTSLEPILPHIIRELEDTPEFLQDEELKTLQNETTDLSTHPSGKSNSIAVGVIFAAKPFCDFITNPIIGWSVDRYGYNVPMMTGYAVIFMSALGLAFSNTYLLLFITRCFQGLGSALLIISGLTFLSSIHGDTPERSAALALVFIGPGVGSIIGFPYGSSVYQFLGRIYPYLILAILFGLTFIFQLFYKPANIHEPKDKMSILAYMKICLDPYIMLTVVGWINLQIGVSCALLAIPLFVTDEFNVEPYEIGLLLLTVMIPTAITQGVLAKYTHKLGWWKLCLAGGCIAPIMFFIYPFIPSFWWLTAPNVLGGLGLGMIVSSFHALLCHITDIRVGPNYGAAFSLNKIGFGIGQFTGSMATGVLIDQYGYTTAFLSCGVCMFTINCVFIILRNVPSKNFGTSTDNILISTRL